MTAVSQKKKTSLRNAMDIHPQSPHENSQGKFSFSIHFIGVN
jgi:hypothetical protein